MRNITRWKTFALMVSLYFLYSCSVNGEDKENEESCLSWRLNVEVHNHRNWWTVPRECVNYVKVYMVEGQYHKDMVTAVGNIASYVDDIVPIGDGFDAWILDIDDTSLSNLEYYSSRSYGGIPYDPDSFSSWSATGKLTAILPILELYKNLSSSGFQVFFLSGRDESLRVITEQNLQAQGYQCYTKLILRDKWNRGKSAIFFKSVKREELVLEGYRIWGNVGDQWSDLLGTVVGIRTFKIPNPMYFVP